MKHQIGTNEIFASRAPRYSLAYLHVIASPRSKLQPYREIDIPIRTDALEKFASRLIYITSRPRILRSLFSFRLGASESERAGTDNRPSRATDTR